MAGNLCISFLHCYDKWSKCYYFKQDWRSRAKAEMVQYVILKWTNALLIGLGTSLVAFFNNIELKVCANGFLYNMARAMAGTVVYAAEGKIKPEDIGAILESGNRTAAGPTVPPGGLYMTHLWYDDGVDKFECTCTE